MHKYYKILKAFMASSKSYWNMRYPNFRSHNDGNKLAAYQLVSKYVDIPKTYGIFKSVWELTSDIIKNIPTEAFVIKALLGNQGKRVICLHRKKINDNVMYKDILRHKKYEMNIGQVLAYIIHILKREEYAKGSALIIEEFIGDPTRGLPQDYKFYVVEGTVKLISIFGRRGKLEYANSYDRDWIPIKLSKIYKNPSSLDYIENDYPLDGLPSNDIQQKLVLLAENLAKDHQALFCRYDFYCTNNKIYFGEITPVCGDLNNYRVLEKFAKKLCPSNIDAYNISSSDSS